MHLRLNDSDMQTLIEMVCLAVQTATWNQNQASSADFDRFVAMEQRILERAAEAGLSELIAYDETHQRLILKEGFRESSYAQECIDELRNSVFWEEMMYRFAERDLIKRLGPTKWKSLGEEERTELSKTHEERYWNEFHRNGIDHFHLIHPDEEG